MKILGISAYYHDSAAAIVVDGEIIAAAQEERFTRKKHDASFPSLSIKYCLEESGCSIDALDAVVFYDKPFLKFERLLETYYGFAPRGLLSFIKAVPVWVKEKLFLKRNIKRALSEIETYDLNNLNLLFSEHHLSHAASAYYPSQFESAAILTIDGVGEWATASICHGDGSDIKVIKELKFPHSLGLLYSAFTYYLGFKVNGGEYKMMGLAPYGNAASESYSRFKSLIQQNILEIKEDGSIWLNQKYFNYATGLTMTIDKKWEQLLDLPRRIAEGPITQNHMDLALAIQHITEEVVLKMAAEAKRLTGSNNLCLAGGVALNCVANGKLLDANIFEKIWVQPAAGDAGGALGGALAVHHIYYGQALLKKNGNDLMKGSYLGPAYHNGDVEKMAKIHNAKYLLYTDFADLSSQVAKLISKGHVVGWFQGRMEFGPRALGHRSILADARNKKIQRKLNLKIKYRESFRPFAPSVLVEDVADFFKMDESSPYMLVVKPVNEIRRLEVPDNYAQLSQLEKLNIPKSDIPAVTHVDNTARIQTVDGVYNQRYRTLLTKFKEITGEGILVNTSFNVRGEPIVCSPLDAFSCFMNTEMDYLVVNDFLFSKSEKVSNA